MKSKYLEYKEDKITLELKDEKGIHKETVGNWELEDKEDEENN